LRHIARDDFDDTFPKFDKVPVSVFVSTPATEILDGSVILDGREMEVGQNREGLRIRHGAGPVVL
jgi:hypothetical protein